MRPLVLIFLLFCVAALAQNDDKDAAEWMNRVGLVLRLHNDQAVLFRQQLEDMRKDVDAIKTTIQFLSGDYITRLGTLPKDVGAALLATNDQTQALAGAIEAMTSANRKQALPGT